MKLRDVLFYIIICLVIIGLGIRISGNSNGEPIFAIGLIGIFIYFIFKLFNLFFSSGFGTNILVLQALIILMSITTFARYLHLPFWDYPGLIVVPLFAFSSLLYLMKEKQKDREITLASILFLVLMIPLFGFEFNKAPRNYVPREWYNRYDVSEAVTIKFPDNFKHTETEQLSIKAYDLMEMYRYKEAIKLFNEALELEPLNIALLFGLSEAYSRTNKLEQAILLLNKAITEDSTFAPLYNNRGLLYYKLIKNDRAMSDYKRAISLDSTQYVYYANIALVYYYENNLESACEAIQKAERLGLDISKERFLENVKNSNCQ